MVRQSLSGSQVSRRLECAYLLECQKSDLHTDILAAKTAGILSGTSIVTFDVQAWCVLLQLKVARESQEDSGDQSISCLVMGGRQWHQCRQI